MDATIWHCTILDHNILLNASPKVLPTHHNASLRVNTELYMGWEILQMLAIYQNKNLVKKLNEHKT